MFTTHRYVLVAVIAIASVGLFGRTAQAQVPIADTCPVSVRAAFDELDRVCDAVTRNEACYVANNVVAAFFEAAAEATFVQPADRVDVTTLRQLVTSPFDPETGDRGVAMMRLQANLPNTLPGQAVVFVLIGDVQVANDVAPEAAIALSDPVTAIAKTRVNARSGPTTTATVLDTLNVGEPISIDARNPAGDWLRGVYNDTVVWVAAVTVDLPGSVNELPVLADDRFGTMQAFQLQTGLGNPECLDAPHSLLVQSPQQVSVATGGPSVPTDSSRTSVPCVVQ